MKGALKWSATLAVILLTGGCAKTLDYVELRDDQKVARLMKLADERSFGEGEIVTRLSDPSTQVRRQAALALGRIGTPEAAGPLAAALGDPQPSVRSAAAFALGLLEGPLPAETLEVLRGRLADPNPEVAGQATRALSRKDSEEAAEAITTALLDRLPSGPPPYVWGEDLERSAQRLPHADLRLGLFALARLSSVRWAWSVLATEETQPRFLWWPAAWTTARLAAPELAQLLLHYAGSNDPYLRLMGTQGLARLSPDVSRRAVLHLLEDPDEKVRIAAVQAAAALRLQESVPRLLELMDRDSSYVQVEAIKALASFPDPGVVEPLIDRLSDPRAWIRAAALRSLAHQDPESFWLLLSGLDPDPVWSVRAALARLLGELEDRRSVALLRNLAEQGDVRVRPHALRALAQASPQTAVPILVEHLVAEDPFERAAAAEELGRLRPEGGVEPLLKAFQAARRDVEPGARLAVLTALDAYGPEVAEPAAREALGDPSWNVRRRGAEILHKLGDRAVRAAGPDTGRSLYEYLDLLHPRYTPQAFIRTEKGPIEIELFVLDAPLTVENFIRLAREGFYNGLTFHRVVPNYVVQAGDPRGDTNGGPGYTIRCEINERPYLRGTVGMALAGKDTGGSQFFITHLPQPQLDGRYTVFGQVLRGMEVVDRLEPGDLIREIVIWDGVTMAGGRFQPPSSASGRLSLPSVR